jgi:hypothetical protein
MILTPLIRPKIELEEFYSDTRRELVNEEVQELGRKDGGSMRRLRWMVLEVREKGVTEWRPCKTYYMSSCPIRDVVCSLYCIVLGEYATYPPLRDWRPPFHHLHPASVVAAKAFPTSIETGSDQAVSGGNSY